MEQFTLEHSKFSSLSAFKQTIVLVDFSHLYFPSNCSSWAIKGH